MLSENSVVAPRCTTMSNYNTTQDNRPESQDDGTAEPLKGISLPSISLMGTLGSQVNVALLRVGL
jgi:hypothetical protein